MLRQVELVAGAMPSPLRWVLQLALLLLAGRVLHALLRLALRLAHMHALTRDIPGPTLRHVHRVWKARRSPSRVSDIFHEIARENRPIFKFWSGPHLMVLLMDADDIEFVLTSKAVVEKSFLYRILGLLTGTGLLHLTGEEWRRRRRIVNPFLHADILKDFPAMFHRKARVMVGLLEPLARSGETFNVQPFAGMAVNDMVCNTVMNTDMQSQAKDEREFYEAIYNGFAILTYRTFHPWYLSDTVFRLSRYYPYFRRSMDVFNGFTRRLLQAKRRERQALGKDTVKGTGQDRTEDAILDPVEDPVKQPEQERPRRRPTFLDVMLDSKEGAALSDAELLNEAKTLIVAASGGSTDALCFVLLCISLRQDVQDRIVQVSWTAHRKT